MKRRRKLIEVSLPLEVINRASAREKSIRHGHPSTLHLWWARRPLAACRAVLFAQLVDDPSSWPEEFPTEADRARERKRLHGIIEEMVPWEATKAERILNRARREIARSLARGLGEPPPCDEPEAVLAWLVRNAPPVCDPFCGGGSIPLEAQRLGLRAHGSDLRACAETMERPRFWYLRCGWRVHRDQTSPFHICQIAFEAVSPTPILCTSGQNRDRSIVSVQGIYSPPPTDDESFFLTGSDPAWFRAPFPRSRPRTGGAGSG